MRTTAVERQVDVQRDAHARQKRGRTTLPGDLLNEQAVRLQLFYAVGVVLWGITLLMDTWRAPQGDRGPYHEVIECLGAVLAAIAASYVRFGQGNIRSRADLATFGVVAHAFLIALLNSWMEQPIAVRPLSANIVLILCFG